MAKNSATISPTAHYTGYTWYHHQMSHRGLVTPQGRLMHTACWPIRAFAKATGRPTVEGFLLARHRAIDHLLTQAIEDGRITQVIEVAAGLSPRGWRFKQRFGDRIRYIEADLPGMAHIKAERLRKAGLARPGHDIVTLDALADTGPQSLAQLATSLNHSQGLAIITEGLLNYFDQAAVLGMWARFASVLGQFPQGHYLSDLHLNDASKGAAAQTFKTLLSTFVRGRVHVHFRQASEAQTCLLQAGFAQATLHSPVDLAPQMGVTLQPGAALVRVIEARTGVAP
jgi:O-methyltransferase involved in polyketide biosynthesis